MMNKNTIIYAAIVVSIAMAGFIVFSGQQDFETQYTSLKASGELSKTVNSTKDVEVKYQTTTKPAEQKAQEKVKEREKFVEAKNVDAAKKFEIAILNEQSWNPSRMAASIVKVSGTIDGSPFFLNVPTYLLSDKSDMKLKVKNLQTGEEKTLFAPFIQSLGLPGASNSLNINSNDMSNYTFDQKPGILPQSETPPSIPNN